MQSLSEKFAFLQKVNWDQKAFGKRLSCLHPRNQLRSYSQVSYRDGALATELANDFKKYTRGKLRTIWS